MRTAITTSCICMMIGILVMSCEDYYEVKLLNGNKVMATEYNERAYKTGDTVCVSSIGDASWAITNFGIFTDTTARIDQYTYTFRLGVVTRKQP